MSTLQEATRQRLALEPTLHLQSNILQSTGSTRNDTSQRTSELAPAPIALGVKSNLSGIWDGVRGVLDRLVDELQSLQCSASLFLSIHEARDSTNMHKHHTNQLDYVESNKPLFVTGHALLTSVQGAYMTWARMKHSFSHKLLAGRV